MMEQPAPTEAEVAAVIAGAEDFGSFPGAQDEAAIKSFLARFPLPMLIAVLQTNLEVPRVVDSIVTCLDKVFSSKYGSSLLLNYVVFIQVGLQANSQAIKNLSCKAVSHLLDNVEDKEAAVEILAQHNVYSFLLDCLVNGDESTSAASMDAISSLAQTSKGSALIFPANDQGPTQIKGLAAHSSSVVRVRTLELIAKLFSASSVLATAVYNSKLLDLFEEELKDSRDMLKTLSCLEVLYELVTSPNATSLLLRTSLLQLLTTLISNPTADALLKSKATLIGGRLLSSDDAYNAMDDSCVLNFILATDGVLKIENLVESGLEGLGQIGTATHGAQILLIRSAESARFIVESAFDRQNRGKQLAALDALGNIAGAGRPADTVILDAQAEECLKQLVYSTASNSSKRTPSGLLLSIFRQDLEVRIAGYRLISALVVRQWALMEICSNSEIVEFVTSHTTESTKNGMDARHDCCTAISGAFSTSPLAQDTSLAGVAVKLSEAVRRGPYLAKRRVEAQPVVVTADRL